jgi:hypothetical protein
VGKASRSSAAFNTHSTFWATFPGSVSRKSFYVYPR